MHKNNEGRFVHALRAKAKSGKNPVIADIKAFSPKEGDLLRGRTAAAVARTLDQAGAPALSVVTEPLHFQGSLTMLEQVAAATPLPILRKDFIASRADLLDSKAGGASAVLLICAMHGEKEMQTLFEQAHALGLEVLVEAHTPAELSLANRLGAMLKGINNRDILALERDGGGVAQTESLAVHHNQQGLLISESGLQTRSDVQRAIRAGANAVLIGTALLRAVDIAACYRDLESKEEK